MKGTPKPQREVRRVTGRRDLLMMASECVNKLNSLFEQCGIGRELIAEVWKHVKPAPAPVSAKRQSSKSSLSAAITHRIFPVANQVVTEWRKDSRFCDSKTGRPLSLALNGKRSLATLVRSVGRSAEIKDVLQYLIESGTVKKVGRRYRLIRPWILLRGEAGAWFQLRYVHKTLDTSIENLSTKGARFQRMVEHIQVPVSRLPFVEEEDRKSVV